MSKLLDWVDHRTGYRGFVHEALYEHIPGGARWRYVWGSTLAFAFGVQMITGVFLWMSYSPSAQTAWESVFYIEYQTQGGWLLRGIHHFMAQAMVVLLVIHLLQVVVDGAYKAPREFNFWIGLLLMQVVLGLSLTGYLLPWDQKGYWATKVATNLVAQVPVIGEDLQRLAVGGSDYGHHTLTRFFALHAGVLPGVLILLLVVHVALFRRHGITPHKPEGRPDGCFWPDQVLKDGVACLAVMAVVLGLCLFLGADLGAPADPAHSYSAARPEWYFLFLFQMLKYFPGESEIYGALVIPGAAMLALVLMPFVGYTKFGHYFNMAFLIALLVGAGTLTFLALNEDRNNPDFQIAVAEADHQAHRVGELALSPQGIPPTGAATLLNNDPKTVGPQLFKQYCAGCHSFSDAKNQGLVVMPPRAADSEPIETRGSNLFGFATRSWFAGLFDPAQIDGPRYFGNTPHREGDMVGWVKEHVPAMKEAERAELDQVVQALLVEAAVPAERVLTMLQVQLVAQGRLAIKGKTLSCTECHKYHDAGELGSAPDLTHYGSRQWLIDFISNPGDARFYGDNHHMPAFGAVGAKPATLSAHQIGLLADWLRGDWYEPAKAGQRDAHSQAVPPAAAPAPSAADATPGEPAAPEAAEPAAAEPTIEPAAEPTTPTTEPQPSESLPNEPPASEPPAGDSSPPSPPSTPGPAPATDTQPGARI